MLGNAIHIIPTALDLLALVTCIGTLAFQLWVFPLTANNADHTGSRIIRSRLWSLLTVSIVALTFSSIAELFMRISEMSGYPLLTSFSLLPEVLTETHYGTSWMVRALAVAALWIGLLFRERYSNTNVVAGFMMTAGALIALTRSASGHAAEWGDFTIPELLDWVHIVCASVWGGGLIPLTIVLLPLIPKPHDEQLDPVPIPYIVGRFSFLAGIALSGAVLTGTYNAWLQVGSFQAIRETSYGQTLMVKLLLFFMLVVLGASNRYISVPLMQRMTPPFSKLCVLNRLIVSVRSHRFQNNRHESWIIRGFSRKVWGEIIFVVGILICTALLLHGVPARHLSHGQQGHDISGHR